MKLPHPDLLMHPDEQLVYEYDVREWFSKTPFNYFSFTYRNRIFRILDLCKTLLKPGQRVLDIGCAQGNLALMLADTGYQVTACDINPHFLNYARRKQLNSTVDFREGNAFEVLPPDEQYDLVIATEIIEHVAYPERLLEQIGQLLLPGGYCILTTPNGGYFKNTLPSFQEILAMTDRRELEARQFKPEGADHLFLFHLEELRAALNVSAFELMTLESLNSILPSVLHRLLGSVPGDFVPETFFKLDRQLCRLPVIRQKFSNTLLACLRKAAQ